MFLDVDLRDTATGERLDWGVQKARFLPDSTPGDNVVELVFILYGWPGGVNWNDGVSKTLYLTDLALIPREGTSGEKPMILEGTWSFALDHLYRSKILEVDPAGAVRLDTETQAMVTLESLTLSPLSVSFTLSYPPDAGSFVHYELVLVCKDGSTVTINGANGYGDPGPDGPGGRDYFYGGGSTTSSLGTAPFSCRTQRNRQKRSRTSGPGPFLFTSPQYLHRRRWWRPALPYSRTGTPASRLPAPGRRSPPRPRSNGRSWPRSSLRPAIRG